MNCKLQYKWKKLSIFYVHILLCVLFLEVEYGLKVCEAAGSTVNFLPGFHGPLPFQLETGYIGVGEKEDTQLFYYFIKSESDNSENDPLMLWLTGGPGCSGLSGLVYEIGPINFDPVLCPGTIPKLSLNPHSWTKIANIIFLDSPADTGFSYGRTPEASSHTTDLQSSDQVYEFLRKWIVEHPNFMFNTIFISGDSYSGLLVPIVAQLISNGNDAGVEPRINLKGYLMGNPIVSGIEINYRIQFAHGKGLISDEFYETLKKTCGERYYYLDPTNVLCIKYVDYFEQLVDNINYVQILEPNCPLISQKPNKLSYGARFLYEILRIKPRDLNHYDQCSPYSCRTDSYHLSYVWANDERVRAALHVRKGTKGIWNRCWNNSLAYNIATGESLSYVANLSLKGYRSLIYSGDHDMVVPFFGTQAWIRSLKYPIVDDWRPWIVEGQVAGYTRTYANRMTFATVKGAGHTAPEYKRPECKAMFQRWISSQPL